MTHVDTLPPIPAVTRLNMSDEGNCCFPCELDTVERLPVRSVNDPSGVRPTRLRLKIRRRFSVLAHYFDSHWSLITTISEGCSRD